jgi:hypothetical protein
MRDLGTKFLFLVVFASRFVLPAVYLVSVWWVIGAIQSRSAPPLLATSRDLPQYHRLAADDLQPSVIGKYLAKDVKKGGAIDGDSVVDRPPPSVRLASRDLVHGHQIAGDDLDRPSAPTTVGKYLTRDVKKGDVIDANVVTDKRPAQTAKRDLARDHQVAADDLDPPDAPALIGKYLLNDIKKGDVVDADAISDKAPAAASAKATRNLGRDHKLVADDLDPPGAAALDGKYLVKDVNRGDVIDAGTVTDKAPMVKPKSGASHHRRSAPRHRFRRRHRR